LRRHFEVLRSSSRQTGEEHCTLHPLDHHEKLR
jgi:hypothetical protein